MSVITIGCIGAIGLCSVGIVHTLAKRDVTNEIHTKDSVLGGISISDLLNEEHEIDMEVLRGAK